MKTAISIRLDAEIIYFFKSNYPGSYQRGTSQVLRNHITDERKRWEFAAGRAQEIYRTYYAQCFWHLRKDLNITVDLIPLVIDGLRRYGGQKGYLVAEELEAYKCL